MGKNLEDGTCVIFKQFPYVSFYRRFFNLLLVIPLVWCLTSKKTEDWRMSNRFNRRPLSCISNASCSSFLHIHPRLLVLLYSISLSQYTQSWLGAFAREERWGAGLAVKVYGIVLGKVLLDRCSDRIFNRQCIIIWWTLDRFLRILQEPIRVANAAAALLKPLSVLFFLAYNNRLRYRFDVRPHLWSFIHFLQHEASLARMRTMQIRSGRYRHKALPFSVRNEQAGKKTKQLKNVALLYGVYKLSLKLVNHFIRSLLSFINILVCILYGKGRSLKYQLY